MKRLLFIAIILAMGALKYVKAQDLYSEGQLLQCQGRTLIISKVLSGRFTYRYAKASPAYEPYEPSTCSDPTIKRDEYGRWIVDKTRYTKPSQTTIHNSIKSCFTGYIDLLKTAFNGKGQLRITFRTNSAGIFRNAEVELWAEPSIYRQIPPEVLCGLLNALDDLQFTIPPEYQCISDHYFHYYILFRDL